MGASMALNVQAKEHEVAVYDLRRDAAAPHLKAGATWADGPREIAAEPRAFVDDRDQTTKRVQRIDGVRKYRPLCQ